MKKKGGINITVKIVRTQSVGSNPIDLKNHI